MNYRAASLAMLAVATMLTAAGCSTSEPGDTARGGASSGEERSLAEVQEAGVLVVATEGTYRPFSYHEDGTGELTGYDVEVVRAVAEDMGVDVRFEETQWDAIFTGLDAGRFDVVANQVSITPEREKSYTFSEPYTYSPGVVVVRADDDRVTSLEDLDGLTTAQSLTSNWYKMAEEHGATVQAVEGWAQAVALVEQSRVDATINDKLTFLDYKKQTGAPGVKIAVETDDVSRSAFAFRKGETSLAEAFDEALATLTEDGTLAEISTTFFGEDVSQPTAP